MIKKLFIFAVSAVVVSIIVVGGSTLATFLFYYLNGEPFEEIITMSRIIGFLVIFILSFFFFVFMPDNKNKQGTS